MLVTTLGREIIGSAIAPEALRSLQANVPAEGHANDAKTWADDLARPTASALVGMAGSSASSGYAGAIPGLPLSYVVACSILNGQANSLPYEMNGFATITGMPVGALLARFSANAGEPLLNWAERAIKRSGSAQALIDRISKYQQLPTDWDGEDTVIISDEAVRTAIVIIDALEYADLQLPQSSPSAEGDIGLNWYQGSDTLEMTISADAHVVWVTDIDDRVEPGRDIEVASLLFPSLIIEAVRGFYAKVANSVPLSE